MEVPKAGEEECEVYGFRKVPVDPKIARPSFHELLDPKLGPSLRKGPTTKSEEMEERVSQPTHRGSTEGSIKTGQSRRCRAQGGLRETGLYAESD
jgi:hypothetical protein